LAEFSDLVSFNQHIGWHDGLPGRDGAEGSKTPAPDFGKPACVWSD
jgi:hypothetical protein